MTRKSTSIPLSSALFSAFKNIFKLVFREEGRGREKETLMWEQNISQLTLAWPPMEIEPATLWCTGRQPTEPPWPGLCIFKHVQQWFSTPSEPLTLCPAPLLHLGTPTNYQCNDRMVHTASRNTSFRYLVAFSDMHTLYGLGSFLSVLKMNTHIWTSWNAWFCGAF